MRSLFLISWLLSSFAIFSLRPQLDRAGLEEKLAVQPITPREVIRFGGGDYIGTSVPWRFLDIKNMVWVADGLLAVHHSDDMDPTDTTSPNKLTPTFKPVSGAIDDNESLSQVLLEVPPFKQQGHYRLQPIVFFDADGNLREYWMNLTGTSTLPTIGGISPNETRYHMQDRPVGLVLDPASTASDQRLLVVGIDLSGKVRARVLKISDWSVYPKFQTEVLKWLNQPLQLVADPYRKWIWAISRSGDDGYSLIAFEFQKNKYEEVFRPRLPIQMESGSVPKQGIQFRMAIDPVEGKILVSDPFHQQILVLQPGSGKSDLALESIVEVPGRHLGGPSAPAIPMVVQPTTRLVILGSVDEGNLQALPGFWDEGEVKKKDPSVNPLEGWKEQMERAAYEMRLHGPRNVPEVLVPWGMRLQQTPQDEWRLLMWDRGFHTDSGGDWREVLLSPEDMQHLHDTGRLPLKKRWRSPTLNLERLLPLPPSPLNTESFARMEFHRGPIHGEMFVRQGIQGPRLQINWVDPEEATPKTHSQSIDLPGNLPNHFFMAGEMMLEDRLQIFILASAEEGEIS